MYKLLIVDDEPLVQIGLRTMIAKDHSDTIEIVGTYANGKDAWDHIFETPPDIVIADIRMPVMTGLELLAKLQLNEVAEVFGLSPAYLSVLFKRNTETGFSEYVYTKKIRRAKEMLLSGDMKIYEVADALGFESAYYFSKVFKKVDGHSPREYIQSKSDTL